MINWRRWIWLVMVAVCCGCQPTAVPQATEDSLSIEPTAEPLVSASHGEPSAKPPADALKILFIGNSHSAPIPHVLEKIYLAEQPDQPVWFRAAPSWGFLIDHARSPSTLQLLDGYDWDVVVLQAQKYSTTGRYHYPYDGALALSERAQNRGARVILYPEWSREGHRDEFRRIENIHREIAKQTGAAVAPVGSVWEHARKRDPELPLYQPDGNHASDIGNYLTACIFYRLLNQKPVASGAVDGLNPAHCRNLQQTVASFPDWEAVNSQ